MKTLRCIYCYANINKKKAEYAYDKYDVYSAFLGYTKEQSDKWISEIELKKVSERAVKSEKQQLPMF